MGKPEPKGGRRGRPAGPRRDWRWRVPAEGLGAVAVALLLVGVGLFKGINLLLLVGYLLAALFALNAVAAGRGLRKLRGRQHFEEPVFAGAPCPVEVRLANPGKAARTGVRVETAGPEHELGWFAHRLAARGEAVFRATAVLPRRGRYPGGPLHVSSGYPFGLFFRRVRVADPVELVVLPRLGWVHRGRLRHYLRRASPENEAVRRRRPQRHPSAQAEFHGLRPWRPGDSPRFIHWRTTARCGELMVREYEDEPSDNLLLVLDTALPPGMNPTAPAFEAAVSLAATVCWEWCRRKGDRLIVACADGGEVLDGVAGPSLGRQVLERLALVEGGQTTDPRALARRLSAFANTAASAAVVAAGASALAGPLGAALNRPVLCLDPADPEVRDFYQPPEDPAPVEVAPVA
jgi:uncharacterized protein (DUF58 family)